MHMQETPWVVLPTYKEAENIERLVSMLFELPVANLQVLVVDDNSPDGTSGLVKKLMKSFSGLHLVERAGKQGLGRAYIHGFTHALEQGATKIVQMDADFSHDPADVPVLLGKLAEFDLVLGSRYVHGISVINWPLRRLLISLAGNLYARVVTRLPFKDVTGGFKAWRAQALKDVGLKDISADGYGFQIITTYISWKKHKRVTEVPIIFTERREGQSKMSKGIIWEALWVVWQTKFHRFPHR